MKILDIALKDMLRSYRSAFALVMMFAAPLLITGLISLAFSGLMGGGNLSLPLTRMLVINSDTPDAATGFAAGQVLVDSLQSDDLADIFDVTITDDEAEARSAVDRREADVVVTIPAGLTAAIVSGGEPAEITLYHDPTLTIGPGVVRAVIEGVTDGFVGSSITIHVMAHQVEARGESANHADIQRAVTDYSAWFEAAGGEQGSSSTPVFAVRQPITAATPDNPLAALIGPIMVGMMIFFMFYTGASAAQSIVQEDEAGTLGRLMTTPTPIAALLAGKLLAVFLMIGAQAVVLMVLSAVAFGVRWGQPISVVMMLISVTVAAGGFGIFVMSFIKTSRQAGPVLGGVLTICGMLGGLFTTGVPNLPKAMDTFSLVVPQGWALRGWKLALAGAGAADILIPAVVLLVIGILLFSFGTMLMRRRFA